MITTTGNGLQEALRAMSLISRVEKASRRVARGLPPNEPQAAPPPTPFQQMGPILKEHQASAIAKAIEAAPPDQRDNLIMEAHRSLAQWITENNGKVVIAGVVHLAKNPQAAETLAAQILNKEIAARDRQADAAARASEADRQAAEVGQRGKSSHASDAPDNASETSAASAPQSSPAQDTPRPALQPSSDPEQLRAAASRAAPQLEEHLQNAVSGIPGAQVEGVRDEKDPARLQEKIEDGQPPETVSDYLAGRVAVDSPEAKQQVVDRLRQSAPVIQDEDHFEEGGNNQFHSHNLQLQVSPDISSEVQVLPREQAAIAEGTHGTYEQQRTAAAQGDEETSDRLASELADKNDQAMQEFNARQDHGAIGKRALEAAGLRVGEPIKIGGRTFFSVQPGVDHPDVVPVGVPHEPAEAKSEDKNSDDNPDSQGDVHTADNTNEASDAQTDSPDQDTAAGLPGQPEDTEAAAPAGVSSLSEIAEGGDQGQPAHRYAKGETVTLTDGSQGTVAYQHPSLNLLRLKINGRNRTVNAKDLVS